jgi:hypothetical protein
MTPWLNQPEPEDGMTTAKQARYSVGTWDVALQSYTPQIGVHKSFNLTLAELRVAIRILRKLGYSAHRRGNVNDGHEDNDWTVLIVRDDGTLEHEVLKSRTE